MRTATGNALCAAVAVVCFQDNPALLDKAFNVDWNYSRVRAPHGPLLPCVTHLSPGLVCTAARMQCATASTAEGRLFGVS